MLAKTFFTDEERKTIAATVAEVEKSTSGEVAVMVTEHSDDYPEARLFAGVSLGCLAALVITDLLIYSSLNYSRLNLDNSLNFHNSLNLFIPLAAVLSACFWYLAGKIPPLLRAFLFARRMEARVQARALRAFFEQGLHRTRDETGVLFFISIFEHKVWVLADRNIYTRITQEALTSHAREVARGVKEGRACESLCQEIRKVGGLLAANFPPRADDVNELPNEVIAQ